MSYLETRRKNDRNRNKNIKQIFTCTFLENIVNKYSAKKLKLGTE